MGERCCDVVARKKKKHTGRRPGFECLRCESLFSWHPYVVNRCFPMPLLSSCATFRLCLLGLGTTSTILIGESWHRQWPPSGMDSQRGIVRGS